MTGDAIRKQYTLGGFPDAIAFVDAARVRRRGRGPPSRHPINYKRVTLVFSTHSEGGLTQKDFDGARKVDALRVTGNELKNTYTSREVAAMTGLTARQLQWWDDKRLVRVAHRVEEDRARRLHGTPLHAGRSAGAAGARGTAAPGRVGRAAPAPARNAARAVRGAAVRDDRRRRAADAAHRRT